MKALILAAGRGSRMKEKTETIPKCMLKLFDKTLIQHCLNTLTLAGFKKSDIGIITGYKREKIQADIVQEFHNEDWNNTNIVFSLMKADKWLSSKPCIVCYSDIIFHQNPIINLVNNKDKIAITYYTNFWALWEKRFTNPLDDLETFKINKGKLIEIGQKPLSKKDIDGQFMGLLKITPDGWYYIKQIIGDINLELHRKIDMTTLLQNILKDVQDIAIIPSSELWLECDNQNDINVYEREFSSLY